MSEMISEKREVLETERKAFESLREELEAHHGGKFVVFVGDDHIGTFDTFHNAADFARSRYGRGPYLIRQVGVAASMAMPASVAFQPIDAPNP